MTALCDEKFFLFFHFIFRVQLEVLRIETSDGLMSGVSWILFSKAHIFSPKIEQFNSHLLPFLLFFYTRNQEQRKKFFLITLKSLFDDFFCVKHFIKFWTFFLLFLFYFSSHKNIQKKIDNKYWKIVKFIVLLSNFSSSYDFISACENRNHKILKESTIMLPGITSVSWYELWKKTVFNSSFSLLSSVSVSLFLWIFFLFVFYCFQMSSWKFFSNFNVSLFLIKKRELLINFNPSCYPHFH